MGLDVVKNGCHVVIPGPHHHAARAHLRVSFKAR